MSFDQAPKTFAVSAPTFNTSSESPVASSVPPLFHQTSTVPAPRVVPDLAVMSPLAFPSPPD